MSTSLNFWHYNKWKALWVFLLILVIMTTFLFTMTYVTGNDYEARVTVEACVVVSVCLTTIVVLSGISTFRGIKKAAKDKTSRSILPLFDSGVRIEVINTEKKISFAEPVIKGIISGLLVVISRVPNSKGLPSVNFSFYPLSRFGKATIQEVNLEITFTIATIKKDIKPEVLQFVKDLKAKGYTSAD